jgi:asparagine synthase (glutamine-hydrolysing)
MSGIAGIIRFDGGPVEPGLIQKMTGVMAHRGPDGINHWVKGSVALGQCMLCTTPESLEETQPLANEDESLILVMDGWLSNWDELRLELLAKGVRLRNRSDAELVLRAYEVWGQESPSHLDGDFAFVIWDAHRAKAFGARDQIGIKPFYYHWSGTELVFASELAPVLNSFRTPAEPNYGAISEFLADQWYSRDETLWTNLSRLVAAHQLSVTIIGPKTERYWSPELDENPLYRRDYIEAYRELLIDCTRRASRSHRPLACDVSGGLDSSAITCVADRLRRQGRLLAPNIEGYTLDFTGDPGADEIAYARAVGTYLGLDIFEVEPSIPPLQYFVDRAHTWRDFPGFPNLTPTNMFELMSSNGCRVELTGLGGDEWLGGTPLYYADLVADSQWADLYETLKVDLKSGGCKKTFKEFVRYGVVFNLPLQLQKRLRRVKRRLTSLFIASMHHDHLSSLFWLSPEMRRTITLRRLESENNSIYLRCGARHLGQFRTLYYPFTDHVNERLDRRSALFGVEPRSPMRSRRFVQFAFSTPETLRLRGGIRKFTHRQAVQGLMPPVIVGRTDEAEFSVTFWRQLQSLRSELIGPMSSARREWVTEDGINRLYDIYARKPGHEWPGWILWGFLGCHLLFS